MYKQQKGCDADAKQVDSWLGLVNTEGGQCEVRCGGTRQGGNRDAGFDRRVDERDIDQEGNCLG